jgi:hypothetical protein
MSFELTKTSLGLNWSISLNVGGLTAVWTWLDLVSEFVWRRDEGRRSRHFFPFAIDGHLQTEFGTFWKKIV